jgi:hypothetical protein
VIRTLSVAEEGTEKRVLEHTNHVCTVRQFAEKRNARARSVKGLKYSEELGGRREEWTIVRAFEVSISAYKSRDPSWNTLIPQTTIFHSSLLTPHYKSSLLTFPQWFFFKPEGFQRLKVNADALVTNARRLYIFLQKQYIW